MGTRTRAETVIRIPTPDPWMAGAELMRAQRLVSEAGQNSGPKGRAHLLSRPIDASSLKWTQRLIVWLTGASHAGWIIETGKNTYVIEGGCDTCTPQRLEGQHKGYLVRFAHTQDAYKHYETSKSQPIYAHASWSVPDSDFKAIVADFNALNIAYNWAGAKSNYFAHWFSVQANLPVDINPAGSWHMPGPFVYQWNYVPGKESTRR